MNDNENQNINNSNQIENNEEKNNTLINSEENKPLEINGSKTDNENPNDTRKKVSIINYILNVGISFIIWNYVFITIFNIFARSVIVNAFPNNLTLTLILYNLAWILTSVFVIFLSYTSNRKKKIDSENHAKTKYILLAIFYIFIIVTNYQNIINHLQITLVLTMFMMLIHILAIWFTSIKIFNKYNDNLKINRTDIFALVVSILATAMVIIIGGFILDKKYSMKCIRNNGNVVDIKFNVQGIENIKINDKDISEEDLILYKLQFVTKFSLIQIKGSNTSQLELIEEYKEEVSDFEEEHEEYKSACSFDD